MNPRRFSGLPAAFAATAVIAVVCASIPATASASASAPSAISSSAPSPTLTLRLTGPYAGRFHLAAQRSLGPDLLTSTWTDDNGTSVRVSAAAGSTVSLSGGPADGMRSATRPRSDRSVSVDAAVTTRPMPKDAHAAVAAYRARHRTVIDQAVSLGMDRAVAARTFSPLLAGTRSESGSGIRPMDNETPIIDSWCVDISGDGGLDTSHACNVRRMDQQEGADWYIADEYIDSGSSNDESFFFPDRINWLATELDYPAGSEVIHWSPTSDKEIGNCTTVTAGVQGENGIQYSLQQNICPDDMGPTVANATKFGSGWSGTEPDAHYFEATEGVTLDHLPPGVPSTTTMHSELNWTW